MDIIVVLLEGVLWVRISLFLRHCVGYHYSIARHPISTSHLRGAVRGPLFQPLVYWVGTSWWFLCCCLPIGLFCATKRFILLFFPMCLSLRRSFHCILVLFLRKGMWIMGIRWTHFHCVYLLLILKCMQNEWRKHRTTSKHMLACRGLRIMRS